MRLLSAVVGACAILGYAIFGAFLMTNGEVTAGSGRPLADTISAMNAADQPYSAVPGVVFAVVGAVLALAWAATAVARAVPGWLAVVTWAAIVACGAPAYFFASFGNLNSVGDTFGDWDAAAAFAVVRPLYLASAIAAVVAVIALVAGTIAGRQRAALAAP
ncbi:hypothetical protein [Microbacterium sediminis]|uniref:Uncharacterized protein n=1 Tax=Microbacterium sediminis TaxID=904291 RepID=A0A1B9NFC0_9MICO|nr:hypothetical protein [Microbacterium sediminis]OCG75302.1 hypothetical protein A7J15_02585 [Microbacterium sediminis]QBR74324.1 hypothetical protein E3O41_07830 [Microbacterium sediminis]